MGSFRKKVWTDPETGCLCTYEEIDPLQPPHDHVIRIENGKYVVALPSTKTQCLGGRDYD